MQWNVADLKVMVQWFKLPDDPEMPARKQELIQRYEHKKLRTVQDVTYLDDDENDSDDVIIDAVVPVLNTNDDEMLREDVGEADVLTDVTADMTKPGIPEAPMAHDSEEEEQSDDELEVIDCTAGIN